MSRNYTDYHSGLPVYTAWQQPPAQKPDYMEWQEPYLYQAQPHHAARQPYTNPYSLPQSYTDPYTQLSPAPPSTGWPPPPPQHSSCWSPTNHYHQAVYCREQPTDLHQHHSYEHEHHQHYQPFNLPEPQPRHTPDLEPNLSVAALASQLERLTAIVRELESRMDAHERRLGDPHAATQPRLAPPFSVPYTAPVSCLLPQLTAAAPADLHHDPSSSSQPAAPAVPPPPPQRSSSCWSSTSHCRSATPLPAAAAIPSLLQVTTIEDECLKTKAIEDRDDVITLEMLVGVISETVVIFQEFVFGDKVTNCGGLIDKVVAQQQGLLSEVVSSLDKKEMLMKEQMRGDKCVVRKLRRHQERGLGQFLKSLSVIAFDPGGEISKLLLSSTLSVVSWFPP